MSYTITKAQYDAELWGFWIMFDKVLFGHWIIRNRLATVTYDDAFCTSTNQPPVVSGANTTIYNNVSSGTKIVDGSSLLASDPDNNALTYSILSGNDQGYFGIDSLTGDITVIQAGIPVGTYTIVIQVDDGSGGVASAQVLVNVVGSVTAPNTGIGPIHRDSIMQYIVVVPVILSTFYFVNKFFLAKIKS